MVLEQAVNHAWLPDARQQTMTHLASVIDVASQLGLQGAVFESCAENEQDYVQSAND